MSDLIRHLYSEKMDSESSELDLASSELKLFDSKDLLSLFSVGFI
jgi:hypothetical protein